MSDFEWYSLMAVFGLSGVLTILAGAFAAMMGPPRAPRPPEWHEMPEWKPQPPLSREEVEEMWRRYQPSRIIKP